MKRPSLSEIIEAIIFAAIIAAVAFGVVQANRMNAACEQRGGTYVRTAFGLQCLAMVRR